MKRAFSFILVLVFALGLFAGCGGDQSDTDSTASSGASNTASAGLSTGKISFVDANGDSVYKIIRPAKPDDSNPTTSAATLYKKMKEVLGVNARNETDEVAAVDYEILIGKTNRPETNEARHYMLTNGAGRFGDWIICSIGKKIVIYADDTTLLPTACEYFYTNILKKDGIDGGINYVNKADNSKFADCTINGAAIGEFSIVKPYYNSSYFTVEGIKDLSKSVLTKNGYKLFINEDTKTTAGEYEIIVGNTNREGITKLTDYDAYEIKISGKKIYLNGGNTYSTTMAVTEFTKLLAKGTLTDADSVKGSYKKAIKSYDLAKTYHPVWVDDFDGTKVDTTKWDVCDEEYTEIDKKTGLSGQNGKRAWRKPANVVIENGMFHSVMTQDRSNYYSGTIRTNNHMISKFGYYEMSGMLPDGDGFWSTLWLRNATVGGAADYSFPEIDVNECYGNANAVDAGLHCHVRTYGSALKGWKMNNIGFITGDEGRRWRLPSEDNTNFSKGFHTFGALWDENHVAFTGDGEVYCELDYSNPSVVTHKGEVVEVESFKNAYTNCETNMILAGCCGFGNNPLYTNVTDWEWKNSNVYYVDYVHVYQLDDGKSVLKAENPFKY